MNIDVAKMAQILNDGGPSFGTMALDDKPAFAVLWVPIAQIEEASALAEQLIASHKKQQERSPQEEGQQ
jgi:hypothetical protein